MARETKSTNPYSTKRWIRLETLPSDMKGCPQNLEYTTYYGTINGERSYYLIGAFDEKFYAYRICVENLTQFQRLKDRLKSLSCTFVVNETVNPFTNAVAWKRHELEPNFHNYVAKMSSDRDCYIGRFGKYCYTMSTRYKLYGRERDWVEALGVYVSDWIESVSESTRRLLCVVF